MLARGCRLQSCVSRGLVLHNPRNYAALATAQKKEGTIADAFASLSNQAFTPLEPRFAKIKQHLIQGNEDAVQASWNRLLAQLERETETIAALGSSCIPTLHFDDISSPPSSFSADYRSRGVAVIKSVLPPSEALALKSDVQSYIAANPHTKAFPADDPQVWELYWSAAQLRARSHPNLLATQRALLRHWHTSSSSSSASSSAPLLLEPVVYADRLRIRQPGDASFALGPHIDGGAPERWETAGYGGRQGVYDAVWRGEWERYDPWDATPRLDVQSDLYAGGGACSAFRMSQGWLALSDTAPGEGTLLVNPLLRLATAYALLRPFFTPRRAPKGMLDGTAGHDELGDPAFLASDNWVLERPASSWLHGATPGRAQELSAALHPHLRLEQTMVHVPRVQPGDYVVWHCDTIHAVDKTHAGKSDSSVMYIPTCPLTETNAAYLAKQRAAFLQGVPGPDFPGGMGEAKHVGRPEAADVPRLMDEDGMRAFGLKRWDVEGLEHTEGERKVMESANRLLDF